MLYLLTNGQTVSLKTNTDVAKFVFFVGPRDGVHLVNKPLIQMDREVEILMKVRERLSNNISRKKSKALSELVDDFPDFGDDIPF